MIWLTEPQAKTLAQYAITAAPQEACGILAGHKHKVERIIPAKNVADDPLRHYTVDPQTLAHHLPRLEREGLELLAFYHSHPKTEPIPSSTDIREATYPDIAHLIISLKGRDPTLAAWRIHHGTVESVPVHVGEDEPDFEDATLSTTQQAAIILSALITAGLLIIISLNLLPPAPPIP